MPIFYIYKDVFSVQKISLPTRANENLNIPYLPESPFFKNAIARVSWQVAMSVPALRAKIISSLRYDKFFA